jgi:hypothetical protein
MIHRHGIQFSPGCGIEYIRTHQLEIIPMTSLLQKAQDPPDPLLFQQILLPGTKHLVGRENLQHTVHESL